MSLNKTAVADNGLSKRDTNTGLVERTPITACDRTIAVTASCVVIANYVTQLVKSLASTIKEMSDQGNCNAMSGTYQDLKWTYYSSGRNCDTTAQHDTIAGAIKKYLTKVEQNNFCGTQCLRMDHGGTWDGWLKLAN
ncbi:uncharacterized protein ATNIH1004_005514 [Aspergillus tanneri]|nr:uncharacterized protein ATNIH1004_005514 [Aspergillus tanneri]KAA8646839.1 hypothetical protein ATNIH1004_005514 [Aspergillus tanneri]